MTLTEGSASIACEACGGRVAVPAYYDPDVDGLAVTRMHVHGRAARMAANSWVVTHLSSGETVGDAFFVDRAGAEHALRRFGQLPVNWREPADVILGRDRTLVAVLVGIIAEGQAMRSGLAEGALGDHG